MKINEVVVKQPMEEGVKDTLANLGLAGAIAAGGAAGLAGKQAIDNYQQPAKAPTAKVATTTQKAPSIPTTLKAKTPAPKAEPKAEYQSVTGHPNEKILRDAAIAAGLKGQELAAFLAQCAHETLDFKYLREFGGSLDFRKYDPKYAPKKARVLGNKYVGDGAKFKGRGFIQITGRYNYAKASKAIGINLVKNPKLAEDPAVAAKIAIWFWQHRVQPNVDNFNDVKQVTKPINPGLRGLKDRAENYRDFLSAITPTDAEPAV